MRKSNWILAAIFAAAAGLSILCMPATRAEEELELKDLPPGVRTALEQHAKGGRIVEVEKEMKRGVVSYEAEVIQDGKKVDLVFSADGEFLGPEGDDDGDDDDDDTDDDGEGDGGEVPLKWGELPDAVKDMLNQSYAGIQFTGLSKESEDGHEAYEAAYKDGNTKHELKLTADGYILEAEEATAYEALPPAVQLAIDTHFRGASFEKAETVRVTVYEIELETADGKKVEAKILPNGELLEADED